MTTFKVPFKTLRDKLVAPPFEGTILGLDPGETTGYCLMDQNGILQAGQIKTKDIAAGLRELQALMDNLSPTHLVYEAYRVYGHKAAMHANNDMHTSQLIGVIQTLCHQRELPFDKQMASQAKGFVTKTKLKVWGFWQPGKKHARDAIRHAVYWQLFTRPKQLREEIA